MNPTLLIMNVSYSDLSIGADSRHGDGGDDGDDVGQEDDTQSLQDAGVSNHPGESEEQHHPPDVEETPHVDAFKPTELDRVHLLLLTVLLPSLCQAVLHVGDTLGGAGHQVLQTGSLPASARK